MLSSKIVLLVTFGYGQTSRRVSFKSNFLPSFSDNLKVAAYATLIRVKVTTPTKFAPKYLNSVYAHLYYYYSSR